MVKRPAKRNSKRVEELLLKAYAARYIKQYNHWVRIIETNNGRNTSGV